MILSMSDKSYSQNGEDKIVATCFPGDFTGHVLDIGAWWPDDFSNSRMFIEQGWGATLVELSPLPLDKLIRQYADNPRVKVISGAVTSGPEHITRFDITADAISTSVPGHAERWRNMRKEADGSMYHGGFYGSLWVPTISLAQLMEQFFGDGPPDFVSIDTEGNSYALAIALLRMDHRPKVLCVEHDNRVAEIFAAAKPYGYKAVEMGQENLILCR